MHPRIPGPRSAFSPVLPSQPCGDAPRQNTILRFHDKSGRSNDGGRTSFAHTFPGDDENAAMPVRSAPSAKRPRVRERPAPVITILSTGINPTLRKKVKKAAKASGVHVDYVEPSPGAGLLERIDRIHARKRMASIVILDGHGRAEDARHLMEEYRGQAPETGEDLVKEIPTEQIVNRICHGAQPAGQPQWHGLLIVQTCEADAMQDLFKQMRSPVLYYGEKRALEEVVSNAATRELIERLGQSLLFRGDFFPNPETVFKWVSRVSGERVKLVRGGRESLVSLAVAPEDLGEDASIKKIAHAFGLRILTGSCEEVGRFLDRWPHLLSQNLLGKSDAISLACERQDNQAMLHFLVQRGALKTVGLDRFVSYVIDEPLVLPHIKHALFDELVARVRAVVGMNPAPAPARMAENILDAAPGMLMELSYSIAPASQLACHAIWRGMRGFDPASLAGVYEGLFEWMVQACAQAIGADVGEMERWLGLSCREIDKLNVKKTVSPAALERTIDSALAFGDNALAWLLSGPIPDLANLASRYTPQEWNECRAHADWILHGYCAHHGLHAPAAATPAHDPQSGQGGALPGLPREGHDMRH